jgi:outer membrane protein TolC
MKLAPLALLAASLTLAQPLLAQMPATPFQPDGKPDAGYMVPDELSLNYALTFALDNNFAIRAAKERLRQQEGILVEVRSAQLPNVSGSASYSDTTQQLATGTGDERSWAINITARQTLFAAGGVQASVESQKLSLEAATLALQAVIDSALLDVRTKFYNVLVTRERIKVQEQNVELIARQLQDVKNRYEAGTVSNFEVLRAEVAVANAKVPLITARNAHRLAIEELRQALGFTTADATNVAKVPNFVGTLEFTPVQADLQSALASAQERRPDLLRLRRLESAAEKGVLARRSAYYPNLSAFASYDWRKRPGYSEFAASRDGVTVGLSSSWAIWDGNATRGRVAQAKSLLEQAKLALEETELSVQVEVRRAISSLQEATELAEASKKVVEQAEEAVRLADARYSAGTATQLDVLQARTDLTTARLNQIQAYYSFNVASASLRRAMGLPDEAVATTARR